MKMDTSYGPLWSCSLGIYVTFSMCLPAIFSPLSVPSHYSDHFFFCSGWEAHPLQSTPVHIHQLHTGLVSPWRVEQKRKIFLTNDLIKDLLQIRIVLQFEEVPSPGSDCELFQVVGEDLCSDAKRINIYIRKEWKIWANDIIGWLSAS